MANYRVKIGSVDLGLSTQVVPVGWDSVLEQKKDSDSRNYSYNPRAEWTMNCARLPLAWGADAMTIFQSLLDEEENCTVFEVSVEVECPAGSDTWVERWTGEFSSKDWKSDRDKKTLSVKPKEINSFDCLKKAWKTEKNIFAAVAWQTLKPYYFIYHDTQNIIVVPIGTPCPAPPAVTDHCWYETEATPVYDMADTLCVYYYHRFQLPGTCTGSTPVEPNTFDTWTLLENNCPTSSLWWRCPDGPRVPFEFIHGQRLDGILEYLFLETGCGLTIKSDFFNINADATAPSNVAYTAAETFYRNLLIFQKSDIKRHDASDPARQPAFTIRLADLLSDLKTMFNLDWSITDSGATFRLEHVSYFEAIPGNDYTAANYKNELEQDKADAPRLTRYFYRDEQCTDYFKGFPIEIYCGEEEKESRLSLFSCDVAFIVSDDALESIGDDGFVLVAAEVSGGTLYNTNNNRPLAWTELHDNFYRHNMAGAGEINGVPVAPLSLKPTRKQPAFMVSHCCDDDFNAYHLQTTALGDGQVQAAKWNIAKDYLELELKY